MKEQSTTKGFAILSLAGMMVKVLSLLYIPFLRVIITDEGYGVYGAAYSVYVFIFVLTNSGIPVAISKLISELTAVGNYKDAVKTFKIARFMLLIIGIFMTGLMLLFSSPISKGINQRRAYLSIIALSPAVLFTSIASAYRGYFQGWGNMTPTAISQVIEQVGNTIFTLLFGIFLIKYGLEAGCAGATMGTSIGAFLSAIFLIIVYEKNKKIKIPSKFKEVEIKRHTNKEIISKIVNYGVPITVCVGMTYAGDLIDLSNTMGRLIVGGKLEGEASKLYGFLVKYKQLINVPIAIITSLAVAILPAISSAAAINDRDTVKSKIRYAFRICFLIAIPSAVGLGILSGAIFNMLKFGDGAYLMKYGSIVVVLMSIMQIQTTILQSIGKLYTATLYAVIGIVCKIVANYFLISIPSLNILGAIYGSIIGYLVPILLNHRMLLKSLNIKFKLLEQAKKPAIASMFMGLVVILSNLFLSKFFNLHLKGYFANTIVTIIAVVLGMYAYLFAMVITGGITKEDFKVFPRKLNRFIPNFIMKKMK